MPALEDAGGSRRPGRDVGKISCKRRDFLPYWKAGSSRSRGVPGGDLQPDSGAARPLLAVQRAGQRKEACAVKGNWKDRFDSRTLEQGRIYWREGCVEDLRREEHFILARVTDLEEQEVKIPLSGGEPALGTCSCPEGGEGRCRHVAAVLCGLEETPELLEGLEEETPAEPGTSAAPGEEPRGEGNWRKLVRTMPREMLESILLDLGENDPDVEKMVLQRMRPSAVLPTLETLEEEIRAMGEACHPATRSALEALGAGLTALLRREIPARMEAGSFREIFLLVCAVFETGMGKVRGSRTGSGMLSRGENPVQKMVLECEKDWKFLIRFGDHRLQEEMFTWFVRVRRELRPFVENVIFSDQWDPDLLKWGLTVMDSWVRELGEEPDSALMTLRMAVLKKLGMGREAMEENLKPYKNTLVVLRWRTDLALEDGNLEGAICLVIQARAQEWGNRVQEEICTRQLIGLYGHAGREDMQREELNRLVLEYGAGDLDDVKLLKKLTPSGQWRTTMNRILADPRWQRSRLELLEWDGQLEELLAEIVEKPSLALLDRYGKRVAQCAPEQVLSLYARLLDETVYRAMNRKAYHAVAESLVCLKELPGGEEQARALVRSWRTRYPGRRSLYQELKQVGF